MGARGYFESGAERVRRFFGQSQSLHSAAWQRSKRVLCFPLFPLVVLGVVSICLANRQIVINTSPSVRPGLYIRSNAVPAIGQLVEFRIPVSVRSYIQSRSGHDGQDWYILKPVVAGPGDRVDTTGGVLRINGKIVSPMPPIRDGFGNALPCWTQSRVLGRDEYFVFSDRISNSFDSRCYGPVTRREIESVRRPLITW
jgi:conjugative transfer signal peptidase TraF